MNRREFVIGTMALAFLLSVAAAPALADEKTLEGVVKVMKQGEEIQAIQLTAGEVTYTVKLDSIGKQVADFDGKKVVVTGEVSSSNEITVKTVKEKKEENGQDAGDKKADTGQEADKKRNY